MRLWDLLNLHTCQNDNILFVLVMGGVEERYPMDLVPYACLIEKVRMCETSYDSHDNRIVFKIWIGE